MQNYRRDTRADFDAKYIKRRCSAQGSAFWGVAKPISKVWSLDPHFRKKNRHFRAVAAIVGGSGVKGLPTFLGGHLAVTPSFDAMLMSLFSLYILVMDGDGYCWSSSALI